MATDKQIAARKRANPWNPTTATVTAIAQGTSFWLHHPTVDGFTRRAEQHFALLPDHHYRPKETAYDV